MSRCGGGGARSRGGKLGGEVRGGVGSGVFAHVGPKKAGDEGGGAFEETG